MKKPTSLLLWIIVLAGVVVAVGLAGCRNPFFQPTPPRTPVQRPVAPPRSEEDEASKAVADYVTALLNGDYSTAYGMLSRDSRQLHTPAKFEQVGKKGMPHYDLQKAKATVTGDTAMVQVQQAEDPATHGFQLVRESGAWTVVYRGGIPGSPDPE
jgi:hypothetical protein